MFHDSANNSTHKIKNLGLFHAKTIVTRIIPSYFAFFAFDGQMR